MRNGYRVTELETSLDVYFEQSLTSRKLQSIVTEPEISRVR